MLILLLLIFVILLLVLVIFLVLFLVFLVFLILVFFVLLFLLLLLLFEILEELFGDVAILGGEFVIRVQAEGFFVMLEGIFPIGLLRLVLLGSLAFSNKRIGQIVGGILAQFLILREQGIRKMGDGFFKVATLVGGRS